MGLFSSTQKSTFQQTRQPFELQEWQGLGDMLRSWMQQKLQAPSALPAGFEEGGVGAIGQTFDVMNRARESDLTRRGLGSSPMAGLSDLMSEMARGGQISQFRAQLPMMEREMRDRDLAQAMQLFGGRPMGQEQKGTQKTTSTQSPFSSIMDVMSFVAGMGGFEALGGLMGKQKTPFPFL